MKTLSYSAMKAYDECPYRYKLQYVERKKPSIPENYYYAICGIVKQKLFEHFYNKQWYLKLGECAPYMESVVEHYFEEALKRSPVLWDDKRIVKKTKEELIAEVKDGVRKGISLIKKYKLFNPKDPVRNNRSEVKLSGEVNNFVKIMGYVDFIFKFDDGIYIIDGKDTADPKKMEKNTDPRQLWIYAFLAEKNYGKLPSKIGFMFWRHDTMLWYDPKEGIEQIKEWAIKTSWNIKNEKFKANPSNSNCYWCKFKFDCEAYKEMTGNDLTLGISEIEF